MSLATTGSSPYSQTQLLSQSPDLGKTVLESPRGMSLDEADLPTDGSFESRLKTWEGQFDNDPLIQAVAKKILNVYQDRNEVLDLSRFGLKKCPPIMFELTWITKLILDKNPLEEIPAEINSFTQLEYLALCGCNLKELPVEITQLTTLVELFANENQIKHLPEEMGNLKFLKTLQVYNNQIEQLPNSMGQMSKLTHLNLRHNQLREIPKCFQELGSLTDCILDDNQIEVVSDHIEGLKAVLNLNLSGNKLMYISEKIGSLKKMYCLNLENNPSLRQLPFTLSEAGALTMIKISNEDLRDQVDNIMIRIEENKCRKQAEYLSLFLNPWQQMAGVKYDLSFLDAFSLEQKQIITLWLRNLEKSQDYKKLPKDLTRVVVDMLLTTGQDLIFRNELLGQVRGNNAHCDDRPAMGLNEIYTTWKLHTLDPTASLKAKVDVIVSGAKTIALRHILATRFNKTKSYQESVEVFLKYEVELKLRLHLLSFIRNVHYDSFGSDLKINIDELEREVNSSYLRFAVEMPGLNALAQNDPIFNSMWDERKGQLHEQLESVLTDPDPERLDGMKVQAAHECKETFVFEEKEVIKRWIHHILSTDEGPAAEASDQAHAAKRSRFDLG